METLTIPLLLLVFIFFVVAMLYSSVGLGGGSAYTALLAIAGVTYTIIPGISLTLNLLVTFIGAVNYIRYGHARLSLILPFILTSIPMSYVGGRLHIPPHIFYMLLLVSLILVALRIYTAPRITMRFRLTQHFRILLSTLTGILLGFISGAVGIGGGIYLIPIILIFGMGSEKEAAASGSVFILANSLAGIFGRYQSGNYHIADFLPLAGAVAAGGFIGSYLGAASLKPEVMKKLLGGVIVIAIILLTRKMI